MNHDKGRNGGEIVRTSRQILHDENVMIVDHFLPAGDHLRLWEFFQKQQFRFVNSDKWIKAFRVQDGHPLRGPTFRLGEPPPRDGGMQLIYYPTETIIDSFIDSLSSAELDIPGFLKCVETFKVMSTLYAYPTGTALSWHKDAVYKGAFIYYVHPYWGATWGGELLVASPDDNERATDQTQAVSTPAFDAREESAFLMDTGKGRYYMPKPNRLIVIRPGVNHMVKKVEPNAGENLRCSISGFFE